MPNISKIFLSPFLKTSLVNTNQELISHPDTFELDNKIYQAWQKYSPYIANKQAMALLLGGIGFIAFRMCVRSQRVEPISEGSPLLSMLFGTVIAIGFLGVLIGRYKNPLIANITERNINQGALVDLEADPVLMGQNKNEDISDSTTSNVITSKDPGAPKDFDIEVVKEAVLKDWKLIWDVYRGLTQHFSIDQEQFAGLDDEGKKKQLTSMKANFNAEVIALNQQVEKHDKDLQNLINRFKDAPEAEEYFSNQQQRLTNLKIDVKILQVGFETTILQWSMKKVDQPSTENEVAKKRIKKEVDPEILQREIQKDTTSVQLSQKMQELTKALNMFKLDS